METELALTPETRERISLLIKEGWTADAIAKDLDLTIGSLKEIFKKERHERLLRKAEAVSELILDINLNDPEIVKKYGKDRIDILKQKQKEAEFIRSTLGKSEGYATRNEVTGADGEAIHIKEIIFSAPTQLNTKKEDKQ